MTSDILEYPCQNVAGWEPRSDIAEMCSTLAISPISVVAVSLGLHLPSLLQIASAGLTTLGHVA